MKTINRFGITLATAALGVSALAQSVDVTVDGRPLATSARTIDGRVYVPMRSIFEALGADVYYSSATKTVRASKGSRQIYLPLGSRTAEIDGKPVQLDAPATTIDGMTMVPLRFVGESLGANVAWKPAQRLVAVTSAGADGTARGEATGRLTAEEREARRREREERLARERREREINTVQAGTVIPVRLLANLNSSEIKPGTRFAAKIDTDTSAYYGGFPIGSTLEGTVVESAPKAGMDNGALDIRFDRLRLPTGRAIEIDGVLTSLENDAVTRDENGRIVAKDGARSNNTVIGGAIGAGLGLILGGKRLESTLLGGALGALIGSQIKTGGGSRDVVLKAGTLMGVRLVDDVVLIENR